MYRIIIGSTSEERMRQIKSLLGTSCYGKKILVIAPKRPKLDGYITWRAAETREERVAAFQDTAASGPDIVIVDGASEDEINQYPENDGFSVYVGAKTKIKTLSATDRKDENNNSNKAPRYLMWVEDRMSGTASGGRKVMR